MPKYELKTTPRCIKCKSSTNYYRTSQNVFLNTQFITEWFECTECGNIQAKIDKIVRKLNGLKISNMV